MRPWRSRGGQLVIPAMLIFPTLMLFVYLIYETAKLSREKIRHQFALDAAAFVELTNYSDFLNRTAYVNGAFPMRIFDEGFRDTMIDCDQKKDCNGPKSLWDILYENGAFPRARDRSKRSFDTEEVWDIEYHQGSNSEGTNVGAKNGGGTSPPDMDEAEINKNSTGKAFHVLTEDNANHFWINWDDANQVYKLYVQIYQLLGAVEDAQHSVLKRLAADHSFLKKSYWLNTGDAVSAADDAANAFTAAMGTFKATPYCHQKFMYYGNRPTGSAFQPWQVWAPETAQTPPSPMPGCGGLFQIMWVDPAVIKRLREPNAGNNYPGLGLTMRWAVPQKNYWNVDFTAMPQHFPNSAPEIHTTVSLGVGSKAAVWPWPTPKFQVRQYP
ncbi:MAG: hypothetical protein SF051_14170 [Elusimicrobiota bacterium]|nr:hypothetical protein [Elusimicrobiota bacterium]